MKVSMNLAEYEVMTPEEQQEAIATILAESGMEADYTETDTVNNKLHFYLK